MKTLTMLLLFLIVACTSNIYSQEMTGNIVVVTKYEVINPGDSFVAGELDSLTRLYSQAITDGNEYILDYTTLRHFWGNNNADYVFIYKVKSWEDVPKANDRMEELFNQKWSNEDSRKAFDKAYNKYFSGKHSDEIYREVK